MTSTDSDARGYRPDIDGLRAIAVVLVLLFHARLGVSGGYVGVDVFFVISGFLITRIIARDVESGRFSYRRFWVKRVRRLLPAMAVMQLFSAAAAWVILLPHDFREFGQSMAAQSVGLGNFYFWRETGYFAGPSEIKPLLHMWSLAVEEQFYLIMPILLIGLRLLVGRNYLAALLVPGAVSLGWSILTTGPFAAANFFLLPARAWELLLGGVLSAACTNVRLRRVSSELISVMGLCAIVASGLFFDAKTVFPGAAALVPCLGTAAVILGNSGRITIVGRVLSLPPIVFVGLVSYSLYLWHWPLFAFASYLRMTSPTVAQSVLLLFMSFAAAVASWRFVETPFRRGFAGTSDRYVLPAAAGLLLMLCAVGGIIHLSEGARSRFSPDVLRFADGRSDRNPDRRHHHDLAPDAIRKHGLPRLGDDGDLSRAPVMAVIGDSHAEAMMPAFREVVTELGIPAVCISRSATIPLLFNDASDQGRQTYYRAVRDQLAKLRELRDVVLIGRWTAYGEEEFSAGHWRRTFDGLTGMGLRVWVVLQVPEPQVDVPRVLALAKHWDFSLQNVSMERSEYDGLCDRTAAVFERSGNAGPVIVNPATVFFCGSQTAALGRDGRSLYADDDHLSAFGARQLVPGLCDAFRETIEQSVAGEYPAEDR